ncbi:MAG: hypothetical protein H6585_14715 [Flavobacteriales bacterium]|nr:hypothetical protein [Flavobacteriales bacterium]MCB9449582.1 hypothetical protein [Flavobacteriales bacterium]
MQRKDRLLLLAFFLSGWSALGYEMLWTRLLALGLGSESLGIMGVLLGFFGGMAAGAWLLYDRIHRSAHPLKWFLALESVVLGYGAVSPFLFSWTSAHLPPLIGPLAGDNHSMGGLVTSLLFAGLLLLPATLCMGATLVALVEARRRAMADGAGRALARLYAVNTLGAALGIGCTIYVFLPALGFIYTMIVLCAGSAMAILLAWWWQRKAGKQKPEPLAEHRKEPISHLPVRFMRTLAILLGLAGIGTEIVSIHLMSQVLENTIYTFANILVVYLAGTFAGAWYYQRWIRRSGRNLLKGLSNGLALLAFSILAGAWMLRGGEAISHAFTGTFASSLAGELLYAIMVLFIPTALMGYTFSLVIGSFEQEGLGKAYALNTLGGSLASLVFGLAAIHWLGYWMSWYLVMTLYLVLFLLVSRKALQPVKQRYLIAACCLLPAVGGYNGSPLFQPEEGWHELYRKDGQYGTVIVSEHPPMPGMGNMPERRLQVNRQFRMGGGASYAEQRMGHFSMLLAPEAKHVLFLGLGTATTLGSVVAYPVGKVDAVELVPEVLETLPYFGEANNNVTSNPNVTFHAADARRYVAASKDTFDLIVADLFHPGKDGAGNLFSLEHYQALCDHLRPDGKVVQWVPLHQFDTDNLRVLVQTFMKVFPNTHAFLALYNPHTPLLGLVGFNDKDDFPSARLLNAYLQPQYLPGHAIRNARDFWAAYVGDAQALKLFADRSPLNTDMYPYILFHAPVYVYEQTEADRSESLKDLFTYRKPFTEEMVGDTALYRLSLATFDAAGKFLQGQIEFAERGMDREALAYYLEAYQADPDFAPVVGTLVGFGKASPDNARALMPFLQEKDKVRLQPFIQR